MKTSKILIPILSLGILVMSCSKDSTPSVSATSAKSTFSSVNTDLSAEVNGLNAAPGNVALNSYSALSNVSSPFGRIRALSVVKPKDVKSEMSLGLLAIRKMLIKGSASERVQDNEPFGYNDKKGVYTWDHGKKAFSKTGESTIIEIDYPTDTASSTNNAALKITVYQEQQMNDGTWNPTSFDASIYVSGNKETELKFTAGYADDASTNYLDLSLYINPYTIAFGFDDTKSTTSSESFSFTKSGKVLMATGFSATFASAADKAQDNPIAVTGYFQLENVRFNASIDGTKASTSNDANDFASITITIDGGNAGHVVWVTDPQTQDQNPYVQYNDGTQESLDTVFSDLTSQLGSLGM